ncbi:uncharacterized protein [Solanum lycopersicum]|uniref:uncharacterized protein n=1 Tax=Solanum lycopersicum TaxID=4081 RepID=UPI003748AF3F
MLRAWKNDFRANWDDHLLEFSYNNSYHSNIGMARFDARYGRRCRSPIGWFEIDNRKHLLEFNVGDHVYLKISPMKVVMTISRKGRLRLKYVGPYDILKHVGEVAYELALPAELASVHPVIHVSM